MDILQVNQDNFYPHLPKPLFYRLHDVERRKYMPKDKGIVYIRAFNVWNEKILLNILRGCSINWYFQETNHSDTSHWCNRKSSQISDSLQIFHVFTMKTITNVARIVPTNDESWQEF